MNGADKAVKENGTDQDSGSRVTACFLCNGAGNGFAEGKGYWTLNQFAE